MLKSSIDRITKIRSLPIIEGYYLVLGGGKIGTNFAEHARKYSFPFVLILDNDRNAPASLGAELIKDANDLCNLMEDKLKFPLNKEAY